MVHHSRCVKMEYYRQTAYANEGCRSCHHGNVGLKNLRKQQGKQLPFWRPLLSPLPMQCCTIHTLAISKKVFEKVLPTWTKWKDILLDVNFVGKKVGLEPILLSKLSATKKNSKYITKKRGDEFTQVKKVKCLCNAHNGNQILYIISIELFQAYEHSKGAPWWLIHKKVFVHLKALRHSYGHSWKNEPSQNNLTVFF